MHTIRVLILSDDPLIRAGLNTILTPDETLHVVGQAGLHDLDQGIIDIYLPDVLLAEMDDQDHAIYQDLVALDYPLIILSDDAQMLRTRNTIAREAKLDVLSAALHAAAVGLRIQQLHEGEAAPNYTGMTYAMDSLTKREQEVLQLLAQGMTNRAIGQVLSIKESTVKFHVNGIFEKLGAQNRAEAVSIASRIGIITF